MLHKVTALILQKNNRQRVNVFLDGEFAFGINRVVAGWLQVGQEISDEKAAELQAADAREIAFQQALRLINHRPRTEMEIRERLQRYAISPQVINEVLERLKDDHFIDDHQFAEAWIENRAEFRPRSRHFLAYELRTHGVEPSVIEEALIEVDDEQMAYLAAAKIVRKYPDLEWNDFRLRLYRYLGQRGFSYDIIREVTSRLWNEIHETPTPTQ